MDYAREQNIINMEQKNKGHKKRPQGGNYIRNYNNQSGRGGGGHGNRYNQNHNQLHVNKQ